MGQNKFGLPCLHGFRAPTHWYTCQTAAIMQRIDYGGTSYAYHANPYQTLQPRQKRQPGGKQEFSLLSLNPHGSALGLSSRVGFATAPPPC